MSKITPKLNKKDLFEELQLALEADKTYWLQNNAKIRAIVTAKTYDEFRDTVAAAHLTPVTKQDVTKKINTWNSVVGNNSDK